MLPSCSLIAIFSPPLFIELQLTSYTLQKSYETKQYKKGLKAADAILKKYPDHGGAFYITQRLI